MDGNAESRKGTVSVFNNPEPQINVYDFAEEESTAVADWMKQLIEEDFQPSEIGVFVRSDAQIKRAEAAVMDAGLKSIQLTGRVESTTGRVIISPMHLAKGLEFRAVAVMACDDEVIPLQERMKPSPTPATSKKCTTPSAICSTSPAPVPATGSSSPPLIPPPSFSTIFQKSLHEQSRQTAC